MSRATVFTLPPEQWPPPWTQWTLQEQERIRDLIEPPNHLRAAKPAQIIQGDQLIAHLEAWERELEQRQAARIDRERLQALQPPFDPTGYKQAPLFQMANDTIRYICYQIRCQPKSVSTGSP